MGSYYCKLRLKAAANEAGFANEQMYGVSQLTFLRKLAAQMEADWPTVIARLNSVRTKLLSGSSAVISVTVDSKDWDPLRRQIEGLLASLPARAYAPMRWQPLDGPTNEGLIVPSQVNFVAKGTSIFDFTSRPNGTALAVSHWLALAWLIPKIREQGGAYGASMELDRRSGYLAVSSYRDPNLLETLATYDDAGSFLRTLELSDSDLTRSIIGSLNGIDPYQLPGAKGFTSLTRYLIGQTETERQQLRDQLFATAVADFRNFADVMDGLRDRGRIVVMGAEETLLAANRTRGGDWLGLAKIL
jgi:Zn-dependent M16 (insulinase) family peptidase